MYTLTHHAYCGMRVPLLETSDQATREEARARAAARLRCLRRRGFPVVTLEPGSAWEIQEPDGCALVPDACGTLTLRRVTFECRECGSPHDSRDDAAMCCAETDWPDE